MLLPDYYGKEEHDAILASRIETTRKDMERLRSRGVKLAPFVELGAERCHRSLVLANDFEGVGIAVDISFDQLKTADHFAELFGMPQLPLRVCCDVNYLPVRGNAVPLVFCYEFLHHFPAVKPILEHVRRILADGTFFFSEEPYKRPRITLYRQRHKIYSRRSLRRSKVFRTLEKFISEPWSDELEHGIVENDRISVAEWLDALTVFDRREVTLASVGGRITSRLGDRIRPANRVNMVLGGGISGTCATEGSAPAPVPARLTDLLLCPNCAAGSEECPDNPPPLETTGDSLTCPACEIAYPVVDGVVFLLQIETFQALYPRFLPSRRNGRSGSVESVSLA